MRNVAFRWLLALLAFNLRTAQADILYLTNGETITGEVVRDTPDGVRFLGKISGIWGEVFFARARVDHVKRESGDQGRTSEVDTQAKSPVKGEQPRGASSPEKKPLEDTLTDTTIPEHPRTTSDKNLDSAAPPDTSIGGLVRKSEEAKGRVEEALALIFEGWPLSVLSCKITEKPQLIDDSGLGEQIAVNVKVDVSVDREKWRAWAKSSIAQLKKLGIPTSTASSPFKASPKFSKSDVVEPECITHQYFPHLSEAVQSQSHFLLRGELVRPSKKQYLRSNFPDELLGLGGLLGAATKMWEEGLKSTNGVIGNRVTLMIQADWEAEVYMFLLPPTIDPGIRVKTERASLSVTHSLGIALTPESADGLALELPKGSNYQFLNLEREQNCAAVWPIPIWDDELFTSARRRAAKVIFGKELPDVDTRWLLCVPSFIAEFENGLVACRSTSYSLTMTIPKTSAAEIAKIDAKLIAVPIVRGDSPGRPDGMIGAPKSRLSAPNTEDQQQPGGEG